MPMPARAAPVSEKAIPEVAPTSSKVPSPPLWNSRVGSGAVATGTAGHAPPSTCEGPRHVGAAAPSEREGARPERLRGGLPDPRPPRPVLEGAVAAVVVEAR